MGGARGSLWLRGAPSHNICAQLIINISTFNFTDIHIICFHNHMQVSVCSGPTHLMLLSIILSFILNFCACACVNVTHGCDQFKPP